MVESRRGLPHSISKVTMRMPTLLPFGEGCMSGEAIDTRTHAIRRGSGYGTSEGWFVVSGGEPRFHLATRPLLPQHDGAARIVAHEVERVLTDIDADHGDRSIGFPRHGVLLVFGAPCQHRLVAGQEHGRPSH